MRASVTRNGTAMVFIPEYRRKVLYGELRQCDVFGKMALQKEGRIEIGKRRGKPFGHLPKIRAGNAPAPVSLVSARRVDMVIRRNCCRSRLARTTASSDQGWRQDHLGRPDQDHQNDWCQCSSLTPSTRFAISPLPLSKTEKGQPQGGRRVVFRQVLGNPQPHISIT
jgi:hypothetical protein